jgi:hypothetical protein
MRLWSLVLLVGSVGMMLAAWGLQSEASGNLERAGRLSAQEVEGPPQEAEVLSDYRAVLGSLNDSIAIRTKIDAMLSDVESIIIALQEQSEEAKATATASRSELELIARTLGGAVEAARSSFEDLAELRDSLGISAKLAVLIADELEELDNKLGPSSP